MSVKNLMRTIGISLLMSSAVFSHYAHAQEADDDSSDSTESSVSSEATASEAAKSEVSESEAATASSGARLVGSATVSAYANGSMFENETLMMAIMGAVSSNNANDDSKAKIVAAARSYESPALEVNNDSGTALAVGSLQACLAAVKVEYMSTAKQFNGESWHLWPNTATLTTASDRLCVDAKTGEVWATRYVPVQSTLSTSFFSLDRGRVNVVQERLVPR